MYVYFVTQIAAIKSIVEPEGSLRTTFFFQRTLYSINSCYNLLNVC